MNKNSTYSLKYFFIKLFSITIAIILVLNLSYNLFLAEKIESITRILELSSKENLEVTKDKIRKEINDGLQKDNILNNEDAELIYKFYIKIKKEINSVAKN